MIKKIIYIVSFTLFVLFSFVAIANSACVNPIFPPLVYERTNWAELEGLKVNPPDHPDVIKRQDLSVDGHGKLNTDFYSITLDANGQSAEELFAEIRADLSGTIYNGGDYNVQPLDTKQKTKWSSNAPLGTLMIFTLSEWPLTDVATIKAGVFLSCLSGTSFVFSTYHSKFAGSVIPGGLATHGLHPVAGNRGFGVHDHGNNTLSIYVKATDRVVNEGVFSATNEALRERIFKEGANVWSTMLKNIAKRYSDRNPQGFNEYSVRVKF